MIEANDAAGFTASQSVAQTTSTYNYELENFKQQVNDSFSEIASLFADLNIRLDQLEERIALYNSRSSHKI